MFEEYNIFWGKQTNGRYTLNHWGSRGGANFLQKNLLPRYASHLADTFKELGISYELSDTGELLVYDPEVVEYEEVTAPLHRLCGYQVGIVLGTHTEKVPSPKMVQAAKEYSQRITDKIHDIGLVKEKKDFENYFAAESKDGICVWWENDADDLLQPGNMDDKYFPFNLTRCEFYFKGLIILKDALKGKQTITLKVPKFHISRVIGKGGANIKRLADELGLRYIKVVACDED